MELGFLPFSESINIKYFIVEQNNLSLFKTIVDNFTALRSRQLANSGNSNAVTLESFLTFQQKLHNAFTIESNGLVDVFQEINRYTAEQSRLSSCDFNVFRMFGVGETMHSLILANLLNPYANHGQKHLFLNIFLDLINVKRYTDDENWIVTAEKGRVDVLLKRMHPHAVVIIENKSNHAVDQPNQLYRYWYQEIFRKISEKNLSPEYIINPPEDCYQLIYLSPAHSKTPSNISLKKPEGWSDKLPDVVPMKPRFLLFGDFVTRWIKISLERIPKENKRLREYLKQYLELWA